MECIVRNMYRLLYLSGKRLSVGGLILIFIFFLFGCAKREPDSMINYSKGNDIEKNGSQITFELGEEGRMIKTSAKIIVPESIITGEVQGVLPSAKDIEKVMNIDSSFVHKTNTDPNYGGTDWIIKDSENNIDYYYSYDSSSAIFRNCTVEQYEFAINLQNNEITGDLAGFKKKTKDILSELGYEITFGLEYEIREKNHQHIYLSCSSNVNGVPVLNPDLGIDFMDIEYNDGIIAQIRLQNMYMLKSKENTNIVSVSNIIDGMNNMYNDGKLTIVPENIYKIQLMYYVNNNDILIPTWVFIYSFDQRDNIAYIFDAISGEQIYNPIDGMIGYE